MEKENIIVFQDCNNISEVYNRISLCAKKYPDFKFKHKMENDKVFLKIRYAANNRDPVYLLCRIKGEDNTFILSFRENTSWILIIYTVAGIVALISYAVCFAASKFKDYELFLIFILSGLLYVILYFIFSVRRKMILKRIYKIIKTEMK